MVAHVGDCRLYRIRDKRTFCLTRDHTSGRHSLNRVVGLEKKLAVDLFREEVRAGDAYLMAYDGLYPLLTREEIAATALGGTQEEAAQKFVDAAFSRGGPDNITLQL